MQWKQFKREITRTKVICQIDFKPSLCHFSTLNSILKWAHLSFFINGVLQPELETFSQILNFDISVFTILDQSESFYKKDNKKYILVEKLVNFWNSVMGIHEIMCWQPQEAYIIMRFFSNFRKWYSKVKVY